MSAMNYAAQGTIPAVLGIISARQDLDGDDTAGFLLIFAVPIILPQLLFSLGLSLMHLLRGSYTATAWYFALAFSGLTVALGPIFLVEYTHLFRA